MTLRGRCVLSLNPKSTSESRLKSGGFLRVPWTPGNLASNRVARERGGRERCFALRAHTASGERAESDRATTIAAESAKEGSQTLA